MRRSLATALLGYLFVPALLGLVAQDTGSTEASIPGAWYLTFPLPEDRYPQGALTVGSSTAGINTVFDHAGNWYPKPKQADGRIVAFTGEYGDSSLGKGCYLDGDATLRVQVCYHPAGGTFSIANLYSHRPVTADRTVLNYSGHPGYDYVAGLGTSILAPADGDLSIPPTDPVNGPRPTSGETPETKFNTFVIDHHNGYSTWYLHADTHIPAGPVKRGQVVGTVGSRGAGDGNAHLHFEVRKGGQPVDPYGWTAGCGAPHPLGDPYTLLTSVNLWTNSHTEWNFDGPGNSEGWAPNTVPRKRPDGAIVRDVACFFVGSQSSDPGRSALWIDPWDEDPYIQSPPLMNISASAFNSVEFRAISAATGSQGFVYFITKDSPNWSDKKRVDVAFNNDGRTWQDYTVRMDANPLWVGAVTGIRIDPVSTLGLAGQEDTIAFDYVRLAMVTGVPAPFTLSAGGQCKGTTPVIALTWNPAAGVQTYDVYRNGDLIARDRAATQTAFTDSRVAPATFYEYKVAAKSSTGTTFSNSRVAAAPASCGSAAVLLTPSAGSILSTPTQTFTWNSGSQVDRYDLRIGSAKGGTNIFDMIDGTNTSVTVSELPLDGSTVYVRLRSLIHGKWYSQDYTYRTATVDTSRWPMSGGDARRTGRSAFLGPTSAPVGAMWSFTTSAAVVGDLTVAADDRVYFVSDKLYAINSNGTVYRQTLTFGSGAFITGPAIDDANGYVYVGQKLSTGACELVRFDKTLANPVAFVMENDGNCSLSAPVIHNDTVVILVSVFGARSARSVGAHTWSSAPCGGSWVGSPAIALDGNVFVACDGGAVFKLDGATGAVLKQAPYTRGISELAINDFDEVVGGYRAFTGVVFIGGADRWDLELNNVYHAAGEHTNSRSAIMPDGHSAVKLGPAWELTDFYTLSSRGAADWDITLPPSTPIPTVPSVDRSGTIYIGSGTTLLSINPTDGSTIWSVDVPAKITTQPVVAADGVIYVGTADGTVYKFGS